jgi:hypothetical protein
MFMHPNPNAALMLAECRHRELQDEATRLRLAREAHSDDLMARPLISMMCRHLGVTIGRALQQLKSIRWTMSLASRGAVPR